MVELIPVIYWLPKTSIMVYIDNIDQFYIAVMYDVISVSVPLVLCGGMGCHYFHISMPTDIL